MVKLVSLYRQPKKKPDDWVKSYLADEAPRWRKLPGLQRMELSFPFGGLETAGRGKDRRGPPVLMSELYFADRDAFEQALMSPEGRELVDHLESTVSDREVTVFVADSDA